ncbi:hypothetical protein QBC35DRAFT_371486 [Podospora australis]|uniref:AAA+ ATPase domain-containing protein n=1 Tax=Podospora australis TaxID=1536484 RepID=A0AAN6X4L2_9PEZI|nr:hypothetical protein QBC35DRAFT_371486 [Podospora australis]
MPANKRKRDILEAFDPNQSDPEDENFEPVDDQPRRSAKKSKRTKPKGRAGRPPRRRNAYGGSDIEDDEELSDSGLEESFAEETAEESEDDGVVNAAGRRKRKAAVKQQSYKEEDSDEESVINDSDASDDEEMETSPKKKSKIVILKTSGRPLRNSKRGNEEPAPQPPPRGPARRTRARTEEVEEPLVELSNSGKHAQPARAASRSKSPEALGRATRTRGAKGLKKPPATIEEASQESEPKKEVDGQIQAMDEPDDLSLTKGREELSPVRGDVEQSVEEAAPAVEDATMEDQPEVPADDAPALVDDDGEDEDEDEDMPRAGARRLRGTRGADAAAEEAAPPEEIVEHDIQPDNAKTGRRLTRRSGLRGKGKRKNLQEPSSDFEPGDDESAGEVSGSEASGGGGNQEDDESSSTPRRGRATRGVSKRRGRHQDSGDEEVELDKDEMAEELQELRQSSNSRPRRAAARRRSPSTAIEEPTTKRRNQGRQVNYTQQPIPPAEEFEEDDAAPAAPTTRRKGGAGWQRTLTTTVGPFGGGGGPGSLLGGPWGTGATGGVETDSSDDEMNDRSAVGGAIGMTPTSAAPALGLVNPGGPAHALGGKKKSAKVYADADPLGVDMNIDFSKVGGLENHINQLKEMVQLPLLYPELFQRFHVTPPRGVLFHGPPGTGKTLLARALAASVGFGGRKITFYMRKGADALSKWVGEAEKQLRLLFEEAKKNQPSIIFFDEIDGLAPVRSSKQEQIHASIVSTLLALMDGMDGRGQVIVIGATNRPDNIDPALRRPGRFDREFYFPLPDIDARRSILDIHTKDWGLSKEFKQALAESTKGYGGADLRALCTEAALNAIQRTYPQVYTSKEKLVVDPDKISIHATDFMISVKKMIPSSERSTASSATPLPRTIEPLLKNQYKTIVNVLQDIFPRAKKTTALEEAMYEQIEDSDFGFGREVMHQEFERSRIYRPRLLISGFPGMGQNYLAAAILHHLEGVHIQSMDLASLIGDGRPLEQVIVSRFVEVKRHKPAVIYIPNVDVWYSSVSDAAITTFTTMLRSISPSDPVLLLGTSETTPELMAPEILKDFFGFSKGNRAVLEPPSKQYRLDFFENIMTHLRKSPLEFPDPVNRKKRVLEDLPVAPPPPPRTASPEEIKAQRHQDMIHLNHLKMNLQPIMEQIKKTYKRFMKPVIPYQSIAYLFDEADHNYVRPDIADHNRRPFEISKDKDGIEGLLQVATGKFFYNLEIVTIEERLVNGYYCRPQDFWKDINRLYLDAKNIGDKDRILRAKELRTNVEVDIHDVGTKLADSGIDFEAIHQRQLQRRKEAEEKARKKAALQSVVDLVQSDVHGDGESNLHGPVGNGLPVSHLGHTTTAMFRPILSPPSKGREANSSSHPLTNGTPTSLRHHGEDVQMSGMEDDTQPLSIPDSDMTTSPQWHVPRGTGPLADSVRATPGTHLSQRSAITSMPPGVSPSQMLNDASTTKTSDPSTNRSRDWSTQNTNGTGNNADDTSQLVDTQSQNRPHSGHSGNSQESAASSEKDWAHSQAAAIKQGILLPRGGMVGGSRVSEQGSPISSQRSRKAAELENSFHDDTFNSNSSSGNSGGTLTIHTPETGMELVAINPSVRTGSAYSSQQAVLDDAHVIEFLHILADRTAGCSVEQLEQVYRELMDEIWKTRGDWNRMKVLRRLVAVFQATMDDIELVQGTLLEDEDEEGGEEDKEMGEAGHQQPQQQVADETLESVEQNVGQEQQEAGDESEMYDDANRTVLDSVEGGSSQSLGHLSQGFSQGSSQGGQTPSQSQSQSQEDTQLSNGSSEGGQQGQGGEESGGQQLAWFYLN